MPLRGISLRGIAARWCWPNLASKMVASSSGPARPRAMGWNGAGGCVPASHARQANRSRTVCTTFQCRGTTSRVSVTSSPSLDRLPWQHGQEVGPGMTTRSRGRCAGNGPRTGLRRIGLRAGMPSISPSSAASSSAHAACTSSSCSSNWSSSLRPRSDEAPNCSWRSFAISSLRCATIASAPDARASASRRANCSAARAARRASMSSGAGLVATVTQESQPYPAPAVYPFRAGPCAATCQPAISGRQVHCGVLHSIPSSNIARVAGISEMTPSRACGHTNRPRSSLFTYSDMPVSSCQRHFTRSPRRPLKM